jgi:hypothetical protein
MEGQVLIIIIMLPVKPSSMPSTPRPTGVEGQVLEALDMPDMHKYMPLLLLCTGSH